MVYIFRKIIGVCVIFFRIALKYSSEIPNEAARISIGIPFNEATIPISSCSTA